MLWMVLNSYWIQEIHTNLDGMFDKIRVNQYDVLSFKGIKCQKTKLKSKVV